MTCFSVSIPNPEQVNTSWVLGANFADNTKAFFLFLKSDANSEPVTNLSGHFVKIFNSSNPPNFFTENCKTYRNIAKLLSVSKTVPVRSFSCNIH